MSEAARLPDDRLVLVCDRCLCATCWYGEFMCAESRFAGLVVATVGQLRQLARENPDNWSVEKFVKIYGRAELGSVRERRLSDAEVAAR